MDDLFNVLCNYLLESPFPYLGTGTATLGAWHDEVRHTEVLSEASILVTSSF